MNQIEIIKNLITKGINVLDKIYKNTNIPKPSVRRAIYEGIKKREFIKINNSYIVKNNDNLFVWLELGDSERVLSEMCISNLRINSVFLDIPYFSRALIGGNRGIKDYDFITPIKLYNCLLYIYKMLKTDDSHVYLMLSGAKSAQQDMKEYYRAVLESNFKIFSEGTYKKYFSNGKPVTNVRGLEASPERLILMSKNGNIRKGEKLLNMNFHCIRPRIKDNYQSAKSEVFIDDIILQSTLCNEKILDPFCGSGIVGERALIKNRSAVLIEIKKSTVDNYIVPKIFNDSIFIN